MARRKLTIGIQPFRGIPDEGYYDVDKTAPMQRLAETSKHNFLSGPWRFGKTLPLDTLKEVFEGGKALSASLRTHDHSD